MYNLYVEPKTGYNNLLTDLVALLNVPVTELGPRLGTADGGVSLVNPWMLTYLMGLVLQTEGCLVNVQSLSLVAQVISQS